MTPGDKLHHRTLGQCEVRKVHRDGSITVCAVKVNDAGANIFRLRQPEHPSNWIAWGETGGGY